MCEDRRKSDSFSHLFLAISPLLVMQRISSYFKEICLFLKNAYTLLVFFNRLPYMQISEMLPRVIIIGGKVSVVNINGFYRSGSVLRPQREFQGVEHGKKIFRL